MTIAPQENPSAPMLDRDSICDASNQAICDVGTLTAMLALLEDLVCKLNVKPGHHSKIDMICAAATAGAEMGARVQADLERLHGRIWELTKAASQEGKEPRNVDQ